MVMIGCLGTQGKKKRRQFVFYNFVNLFSGDFCWDMFSKLQKSFKTFNFRNKNKNLLQCDKYAFVFSAVYMCQDQKKIYFQM